MCRYISLLLFIGLTWGQNPCEDPRYLDIKKKSLDEMSDREYEYFMMKEKECMSYSSNPITEGEIALTDTVCISTKFGDIKIELYPNVAPMHVENFLTHIKNGYYDGTIFHRVIPGFMIQGGDPNTKDKLDKGKYGSGGRAAKYFGIGDKNSNSTWTVPAEFSDMQHTRGILSMARGNSPSSAGSQFYICVADAPHLNGQYSVFGKVIDGLNVVDETVNLRRDKRDNPLDRIEMNISICQ